MKKQASRFIVMMPLQKNSAAAQPALKGTLQSNTIVCFLQLSADIMAWVDKFSVFSESLGYINK